MMLKERFVGRHGRQYNVQPPVKSSSAQQIIHSLISLQVFGIAQLGFFLIVLLLFWL